VLFLFRLPLAPIVTIWKDNVRQETDLFRDVIAVTEPATMLLIAKPKVSFVSGVSSYSETDLWRPRPNELLFRQAPRPISLRVSSVNLRLANDVVPR
jgi:hypothetical protein